MAQGLDAIEVICAASKGNVLVRAVFDSQGQVNGLWIFPLASVPSVSEDGLPPKETSPGQRTKEIATAKRIANLLNKSKFDEVRKTFNPTLKEALTEDKLLMAWNQMIGQVGEFNSVTKCVPGTSQGYEVVDVMCATKQAGLVVRVAFDGAGAVGGLWLFPAAATPSGEEPKPKSNLRPTFP